MSEQPNYYSVIPANVRYDEELSPSEKIFYSEITALSNAKGYCWASNSHFAKHYKVTTVTVSRWVAKLADRGYITVKYTYHEGTQNIDKRVIIINDRPINKNVKGGINKNVKGGINKNVKENNTSINTTSINNIYSRVNSTTPPYKAIIDYLNQKTGKNYRSNTQKTKNLIKSRYNEGFTLEDFKQVIDTKVASWGNNKKMDQYLRPETLFSNKFESYLNEKPLSNTQSYQHSKENIEVSQEDIDAYNELMGELNDNT